MGLGNKLVDQHTACCPRSNRVRQGAKFTETFICLRKEEEKEKTKREEKKHQKKELNMKKISRSESE